jgi:hypothetical protein
MSKKISARIIYRGPSMLDQSPIVAVMIPASSNKKTGAMDQIYILADSEKDPLEINRLGLDFGICGNCKFKGDPAPDKEKGTARNRACYVTLFQGPLIVWKSLRAGKYLAAFPWELSELGRGRNIRLGAYGDPAAIPAHIIEALLEHAAGHTGYSHQWDLLASDKLAARCMISADTETIARVHWAAGRRTFRVIDSVDDIVPGSEILCPATAEAGRRTNCNDCGLCAGSSVIARNIAAVAHGNGAKYARAPG